MASGTAEVGWSRNTGWLLVANLTELQSAFLSSVGPGVTQLRYIPPQGGAGITPPSSATYPPPNSSCLGPPHPRGTKMLPAACVPLWALVAFPKALPQAPSNQLDSGPSVEVPYCGSVLLPGPCRPSLISDSDEVDCGEPQENVQEVRGMIRILFLGGGGFLWGQADRARTEWLEKTGLTGPL